ncbi:AAA family ATPase [Corynebacterium sp. HMSC076C10]|uniref:AAA family ATPase n=1 Tax=Corynebacterium sp. HMSC076C10 TaxID=1739361 RepID=UPI000AD54CB1|nr:AAA family ATPase [Corynebacterium sp. HMSC076C10]
MNKNWSSVIESIDFYNYRNVKGININFSESVNLISGENGTGKSSILFAVANSFKKVNANSSWINEERVVKNFSSISNQMNPKIEKLLKSSKANPNSESGKGPLYRVNYQNGAELNFRKHNSVKAQRFAVKPPYKGKQGMNLPSTPVLYLGLSRLIPFGEEMDVDTRRIRVAKISNKGHEWLVSNYERLTGLKGLANLSLEGLSKIKTRGSFDTDIDGVDSNTISAGQDNLFIILYSLALLIDYVDSVNDPEFKNALFLIDEIDATLHPSMQFELYDLLTDVAEEYNIQTIATTHSIDLLEHALLCKGSVTYLRKVGPMIKSMDDPTSHKIRLSLRKQTVKDLTVSTKVFLWSEDREARLLLQLVFNKIAIAQEGEYDGRVKRIVNLLEILDINVGGDQIRNIMKNDLLSLQIPFIAVLDGDKRPDKNYANYRSRILFLPGDGVSPEKFLLGVGQSLIEAADNFWDSPKLHNLGYSPEYFISHILGSVEEQNKRGNKKEREVFKSVFNKNQEFFCMLFKHWLNSAAGKDYLEEFCSGLVIIFRKVSAVAGIPSDSWDFDNG